MVDQRSEHRRHTAEDAYPFRRDILKRGLWIEAHVLNNLRSLENSEQNIHRERIDVEWWKHRKEALLTFGKHRNRLGGIGDQIGLEIPIVAEQFGEADVAVVPCHITQLSAGLHLGHHRV